MALRADGTRDNTVEWKRIQDPQQPADYIMHVYHPAAYNMSDTILDELMRRRVKAYESYNSSTRNKTNIVQYDQVFGLTGTPKIHYHNEFLEKVFNTSTTSSEDDSKK